MKVLFDVNMPRPLRRELPGHEVVTAQAMGWGELVNGDLLQAAEKEGFDAFVTADRNLRHQQNLTGRRIAILVVPSNNLRVLARIASAIRSAVDQLKSGNYVELTA
jgi:predicted nuclease of predicted toxin-antitoxin system